MTKKSKRIILRRALLLIGIITYTILDYDHIQEIKSYTIDQVASRFYLTFYSIMGVCVIYLLSSEIAKLVIPKDKARDGK